MRSFLSDITSNGGEGIMLREPMSPYIKGRSLSLKRVKQYTDMEVKFVQKYDKMQGLVCEL